MPDKIMKKQEVADYLKMSIPSIDRYMKNEELPYSKIGKSVRLSPGIKIKMPWRLYIGDYSWIGEDVWIDNLQMSLEYFIEIEDYEKCQDSIYRCTNSSTSY